MLLDLKHMFRSASSVFCTFQSCESYLELNCKTQTTMHHIEALGIRRSGILIIFCLMIANALTFCQSQNDIAKIPEYQDEVKTEISVAKPADQNTSP